MQNSGQRCKNHKKFGVVFRSHLRGSVSNGRERALISGHCCHQGIKVEMSPFSQCSSMWELCWSSCRSGLQLGISSIFYTLSPFCSPSAVSQLFLTTDINLAGLLFPALSSDPLFFACPGWVQLNWFFFVFILFSVLLSPRCPALSFLLLLLCSEQPAFMCDCDLAAANFPLTRGHSD